MASFHTTGMNYRKKKNLGCRGPFSHDHIPPPRTYCQFNLKNLGSTNKTPVQQGGKIMNVEVWCLDSNQMSGVVGALRKNEHTLITLLQTARTGPLLKFISSGGLMDLSVGDVAVIVEMAHVQTHSCQPYRNSGKG